jgi:ribosomal protein S27AE
MKHLICPKCGYSESEPSLVPHSVAIGTFQHNRVCNKCGYEGIFFLKDQFAKL